MQCPNFGIYKLSLFSLNLLFIYEIRDLWFLTGLRTKWCIYASDKWTTNMRSCWSRSGKAWEGGKEVSWVVQGLLNNRWLVILGPFLSQVLSSLCHVRLRYSQGAVRQGQHQLMPNICHQFLQLKIFQGFMFTGEKICNCVFFFLQCWTTFFMIISGLPQVAKLSVICKILFNLFKHCCRHAVTINFQFPFFSV